MEELTAVMELYQDAKKREFCPWTEDYPTEEIIRTDIGQGELYCFKNEAGEIVGCIARDGDEEIDALPFWSGECSPAAELARLVVARGYENQGIARELIRHMQKEMKDRGFHGIHYLVAEENVPAVRSYRVLGFSKAGETDLFGIHYLCYEQRL